MAKNKRVTFPHMGSYAHAFEVLARLLGDEVVLPPPITRRTLELGAKYGPETACIPFKYNLGNFIEALERGANVLVQGGGGCRFGYYGEVQMETLRKLGWKFEYFKLRNNYNLLFIARDMKKFNRRLSYRQIFHAYRFCYYRVRAIDQLEAYLRRQIGFAQSPARLEELYRDFLAELSRTKDIEQVKNVQRYFLKEMRAEPVKKPRHPLRVAVVGELYLLMEPFANFFLERELARFGVEVFRYVTVTSMIHDAFSLGRHVREHLAAAQPYLRYHIGAHATESVARTLNAIRAGFDGVIHVKPFACMPEVSAMSALQRIAREHRFPIVYLSFDTQTSETGLRTRLEAFCDMLFMKRQERVRSEARQ
jgi:predicted nucleotide-binding protein (sugar kinase/HSP70/actin superfamily)